MDITVTNVGEVTLVVTIWAQSHQHVTFTFDPNDFDLDPAASQTVTVFNIFYFDLKYSNKMSGQAAEEKP